MAWHKILVTGIVASVAIVGCTVTSSTGTPGDGGGTGGSTSGSDSGTGGKTGTGGGTATGGKTGTGGGTATGGNTSSGGATSTDAGPETGCTKCLKAKCKTTYDACSASSACGGTGEFYKIQSCLIGQLGDGGTGVLNLDTCVSGALTDGGATVAPETTDLLACMRTPGDAAAQQPCTVECFGDVLPP